MDNQTVLQYILTTDQLLNDLGNVTRMENKAEREAKKIQIKVQKQKMQRSCYDPYLFAKTSLGSDKMEYTCLVCGKVIGGTSLSHVVNLSANGLIEGDDALWYAVNQLKKYLEMDPALTEVEIREAIRSDLIEFARQR